MFLSQNDIGCNVVDEKAVTKAEKTSKPHKKVNHSHTYVPLTETCFYFLKKKTTILHIFLFEKS